MKNRLLAFVDVETTGLDPERHEIIEIGLIVAKQLPRPGRGPELKIMEEWGTKVKPQNIATAEPEALRINQYNEADWLFAADLKPAMETFGAKAKDAIMVGQNVSFDWSFIDAAFKKSGIKNPMQYRKLDLVSIAFAKLYDDPQVEYFNLESLAKHFNILNPKAHTALADIKTTFEIYKRLLNA